MNDPQDQHEPPEPEAPAGGGLADLLGGAEGPDGGSGLDLGALLGQAQAMQQQLLDAQAAAAAEVVVGQSGGGAVRIEATGGGEFVSVHLDPSVGDDHDLIADLVLAALRDVMRRVEDLQRSSIGGTGLGGLLGGDG